MSICGRHRVVVAAVTHQRQWADLRGLLFARVVKSRWERKEGLTVAHQPLADGVSVTTSRSFKRRRQHSSKCALSSTKLTARGMGTHEGAPRVAEVIRLQCAPHLTMDSRAPSGESNVGAQAESAVGQLGTSGASKTRSPGGGNR